MAGSVENRGKGKWRLTVYTGIGPNGKYSRKRRTVTAKNITEARKLLTAFENEINNDEYIEPSKLKFGAFVEDWRKLHAEKHLASNTIETYNYFLNRHILPAFEHKPLQDIKPIHIKQYLDSLDYSTATIQKHYTILRSIFAFACDELELIKSNPVAKVKKPKVRSEKYDVYTEDEVMKLFSLLEDELIHYALIVKIAIMGGLRRGEILGMQWDNVDFEQGTIYIEYSLTYTKNMGYELKRPKNDETRTVAMPQYIMDELKEYHHQWKKDKFQASELWMKESDYVFSTHEEKDGIVRFGKPFYPDSVSRWWTRFLKRTGFKKIPFHSLRHTAATLLINQGEHPKNISERLGHKDIQITMNLYGHYLQEANKKAADKLQERFGKKG